MPGLKPCADDRGVAPAGAGGSLRRRLLLGTLAWILASLLVAGWGLGRLFQQHVERQLDAELGTHLNQLAAALALDADGRPQREPALSDPRFVRPYSGLYWQIDRIETPGELAAQRALLRSRSLWDAVLSVPADALADGELHVHRVEGPDGQALRMIERVLRPAERPEQALRLILAANEALVDAPVARLHGVLVLALGVLAAGLAGAAVVQLRLGLAPLARLRDALAAVHQGRRSAIEGRFPSEIQPLVDEFNAVLARNAEVVERARTQAGNLAHALKTPLSVLANAAAGDEGALAKLVAEQVGLARTQVDYHLARARAAAAAGLPGQRTPLRPVLEGLLRLMDKVHAERGLQLRIVDCAPALAFRGEVQDLQEMLGNLLDNACKWAATTVELRCQQDGEHLYVLIDDDGPGLPEAAREAVFARGARADEHAPGSGLGLAIVRELAELYGGSIALEASPLRGVRAALRLPAG